MQVHQELAQARKGGYGKPLKVLAVLACLAAVLLFLTFNRHSKSGYFNYHSVLWADRAGYYVFLPATFIFGFDARAFPDSIDHKTGDAFRLDHESNKVLTKYPCGVAVMQTPFFVAAHLLAPFSGSERNGFSPVYHHAVLVAAVFYLLLGLYFLRRFLAFSHRDAVVYPVLALLFLGTNLYYYSIDEAGMSHIYSFALFAGFLFFLRKRDFLRNPSVAAAFLLGILTGMVVLVRPTDILILSALFFLDANDGGEVKARVRRVVSFRVLFPALAGLAVALSPQLAYWQYAFGSPVVYSYGTEGFNWFQPKLLHTWFSPDNGLFLYGPAFLAIVASLVYMVRKRLPNGIYLSVLFILLSYLLASWYEWSFGCSFGARNYVEYLALFSIPLAAATEAMARGGRRVIVWAAVAGAFLVLFNLKMTYSYDGCFAGSHDWDWPAYIHHLVSPTK